MASPHDNGCGLMAARTLAERARKRVAHVRRRGCQRVNVCRADACTCLAEAEARYDEAVAGLRRATERADDDGRIWR